MAEMICPICGAKNPAVNSWTRCGKHRAYVCEKHCKDCEFFSGFETSMVYCDYRRRKKMALLSENSATE